MARMAIGMLGGLCLLVVFGAMAGCKDDTCDRARMLMSQSRYQDAAELLALVPEQKRDEATRVVLARARAGWLDQTLGSERSEPAVVDQVLALAATDEGVRADSVTVPALSKGAANLASRKDYDRGMRCHEILVGLQKNRASAVANMPHWVARIPDTAVQGQLFQRALNVAPNAVDLFEVYSDWLSKQGRQREALDALHNALDLTAADSVVRERLSKKMAQLKKVAGM